MNFTSADWKVTIILAVVTVILVFWVYVLTRKKKDVR